MFGSPEYSGELARTYGVLHRLGLSANYRGFYQMAWAVQLARREPGRLLLVTKCIYPDVARHCRTSQMAVERNLRTAGKVIWEARTPLLREVVGEGSGARPCTARLLAMIAAYQIGRAHV